MKLRVAVAALAITALVLAGCVGSTTPSFPTSAAGLQITTVNGAGQHIAVEVANTPDQRAHGLSDRDALPPDAGMLFDMQQVLTPNFWMKDMRFPLDMVWINASKQVVGVTQDVQPQPGIADSALTLYTPPSPVRYVLELNAGAAQRLALAPGTDLSFDLPPATTPLAR